MIDVHVLIRENPNPEHLQRCMDSLKDQPITLHTLPGVMGHIGQGRIAGYSLGTNPWVCYVDDDDWVLPETFEFVTSVIRADPYLACVSSPALHTPRRPDSPTKLFALRTCTPFPDHLCVYRRDLLAPLLGIYEDKPTGGDVAVTHLFRQAYPDKYIARVKACYGWSKIL